MPRHVTSRRMTAEPDNKKLSVFKHLAHISAEIQEYGSAGLGAVEALLIVAATAFLYSTTLTVYVNYASFIFISGQVVSLIVNGLDFYELLSHTFSPKFHSTGGYNFPTIAHFIITGSYIMGSLLICLGNTLVLSYIEAYAAAPWVFLAGSIFFTIGAAFGSSDSMIQADQFVKFFGSLFGKCNIVGTFSFLFGSVLGVVKLWAPTGVDDWLQNIIAATFQTGGIFFFLASLISIFIIIHKHKAHHEHHETDKLSHSSQKYDIH